MSNLFLFSARYPYKGVENFLEDEIIFLCRKFKKVYIIPFKDSDLGIRAVPDNSIVYAPVIKCKKDYLLHGIFNKKSCRILIKEFFVKRAYSSIKRLKVWFTAYLSVNYLLNSKTIKTVEKQLVSSDVCYFYWGKWSNLLSIYWKGKAKMVSRFHGEWDLWEESYDGYAPLRNKVAMSLNRAVFISQKGAAYFKERYPVCNVCVYRLGSKDIGTSKKSGDGVVRVVSCSTVYPLKRVDLILKSLIKASELLEIEWTHLGGGDDFWKLNELCKRLVSEKLKIDLKGQVDYSQVLHYYQTQKVDAFINLSINEGIPVSIMEAISCNIPVIATNVGAISEIITEQTGRLVSPNPSVEEVAEALCYLVKNKESYAPRTFWKQNYMADINYVNFSDFLINL